MMTERQRKFREQYVANISPWYNGVIHILGTYGVGFAMIAWCVSRMQDSRWEWLLVVPVAIAGNFVEWGMHKFVMHRLVDVFALRAIYDRHTRQHHQYFTDNDVTIDTTREFRIVFFPWRLLAEIPATTIAALMTASNLGSRITGYGFIVFTLGSIAWLTLGIATGQANVKAYNRQLRDLIHAGRAKPSFIVSHELQEPLRMVSSYTTLLAEDLGDSLDETARQELDGSGVPGPVYCAHW